MLLFDSAAAGNVSLCGNLVAERTSDVGSCHVLGFERSGCEASVGWCAAVAVGMYGKIMIMSSAVYSSEVIGCEFGPSAGGALYDPGALVCSGCGVFPAAEVDEHDMVPPDKWLKPAYHWFEAVTSNNSEPDYVDTPLDAVVT